MKIPFLDLAPVHRALEAKVFAALKSVYRRNAFVLGEEVRLFEKEFARYVGARHGVGTSSGTSALALALRALGVGLGDEVITSPFTFFATASSVVEAGAKPVFADIDPFTLNLDPARLPGAFSRRTRAVLPVHLYGQAADMGRISAFARKKKIHVVEDACQAHGATFLGRAAGTWGAAAAFSFYPSKNMGALGDAGMVVTDSRALADKVALLRNCGRKGWYDHREMGYNERLDNIQAAVLRIKLKELDAWNAERRGLAEAYRDELAGCPALPVEIHPDARPVYTLFTVRAPRRDALKDFLAARGVGAAVAYPIPLHLQKAFASLKYKRGDFPESEKAAAEVLSLPMFPGLGEGRARRAARAVREFYSRGR